MRTAQVRSYNAASGSRRKALQSLLVLKTIDILDHPHHPHWRQTFRDVKSYCDGCVTFLLRKYCREKPLGSSKPL